MTLSLTEKFFKKDGGVEKLQAIEKSFWGKPVGSKMYISSTEEIANEIKKLKPGQFISVPELREKLAAKHQADFTCPLTTGIFLRIVVDYWFEDPSRLGGELPYWRVINPKDKLFKKLSFEQQQMLNNKQSKEQVT